MDVKRKLPFLASDFYDALHIQSLSAIMFIYLGTVTNAITFGGLLGDATENMQVRGQLVALGVFLKGAAQESCWPCPPYLCAFSASYTQRAAMLCKYAKQSAPSNSTERVPESCLCSDEVFLQIEKFKQYMCKAALWDDDDAKA